MTVPGARGVTAALVTVAAMFGLGVLSRAPYNAAEHADAVVRLSWRARGERVQECRSLTEEEKAKLPRHMRPPQVCEGRFLPYVLDVTVDGRRVIYDTVHAAGARQDRPIYVYRELRLRPGQRTLSVLFKLLAPPPRMRHDHEGEPREDEERSAEVEETPASLAVDTTLTLSPRDVVLVTYVEGRRALEVRRSLPSSDEEDGSDGG